ncbi:transcriptional repressor [Brytella acorum]|uniref:Ferric uptake regulation protein n=1 Tax=Brytella acorum TaxID=2959299 RepID=A0AA35VB46_9PROT|nr:transcriptional repressor [Brytella acorum]MDF3625072.1 transcriptional repressor [Brytella acorum]CAI9121049.1 transcriptional repressor [Brytella acorum]
MNEMRFPGDVEDRLSLSERYCALQGSRLTDTRRQVLGMILSSPRPIGAYDLLDLLRSHHRNAAPPTVYRALEFLSDHGLIHKIERLSAFVGCSHRLRCHHGKACGHRAQFLICRTCGIVKELENDETESAVNLAARNVGFHVEHTTIEVEGICAQCAEHVS